MLFILLLLLLFLCFVSEPLTSLGSHSFARIFLSRARSRSFAPVIFLNTREEFQYPPVLYPLVARARTDGLAKSKRSLSGAILFDESSRNSGLANRRDREYSVVISKLRTHVGSHCDFGLSRGAPRQNTSPLCRRSLVEIEPHAQSADAEQEKKKWRYRGSSSK